MENNFVRGVNLTIGLCVRDCDESPLTSQVPKVVSDLSHIKLLAVVKDHYARYAKTGDVVLSNKLSNLSCSDVGDNLYFYPFYQGIHSNEQVLALACGCRERPLDIHPPGGKQ